MLGETKIYYFVLRKVLDSKKNSGRQRIMWEDIIKNYIKNLGGESVGRLEQLTGIEWIDDRLGGKKIIE